MEGFAVVVLLVSIIAIFVGLLELVIDKETKILKLSLFPICLLFLIISTYGEDFEKDREQAIKDKLKLEQCIKDGKTETYCTASDGARKYADEMGRIASGKGGTPFSDSIIAGDKYREKRKQEKLDKEISLEQYEEIALMLKYCPTTRKNLIQFTVSGIPMGSFEQIKTDCNREKTAEVKRKLFFEALSKE
jgi:hypothetical protein